MAEKAVQEDLGQRVIEAVTDFARSDLKTVAELEVDEFVHVTDPALRLGLAQVFYGVRWIYKLGLALLVKKEERAAHARAQLVDYASVCEGLLFHCIEHAIQKGQVSGTSYMYKDPDCMKRPIKWNTQTPRSVLQRLPFWWLVRIAKDSGVISAGLADDLRQLRLLRNTVHLRSLKTYGQRAYLNQSKAAYMTVCKCVNETKLWKKTHP